MSNIDISLPRFGPNTAEEVRGNFVAAAAEIDALAARLAIVETSRGLGVTDGSEAQPGAIGEFYYTGITEANAVALASGVVRDVLAFTLPPGDWDIQGALATTGSSTNVSDILLWVSDQSATRPTSGELAQFSVMEINFGSGGQSGADTRTQLMTGMARRLFAVPTTFYLSCAVTWNGGTVSVAGSLRARRMR